MGDIRFIHAADLHLGSPFTGMKGLQKEQWKKLKDSTFDAFDRLIDYALKEQPHFILIAGDVYDGEDRSIRAQHRFQQGMVRLSEKKIPVVLSYGNHDHLSGQWPRFELPENVHVFDRTVSQKQLSTPNGEVIITGFSYAERHVKESMIDHYPPAGNQDAFYIGMLHGSMDGETSHAVYAPFTKKQLLSKNYDYWALGHIHLRQELNREPAVVYPGNIQGRHKHETGAKGFYNVRLSKAETQLQFIPASVVRFEELEIDCSGVLHMNELLAACATHIGDFVRRNGSAVIELKFINLDAGAAELMEEVSEEELLETLQESLEAPDGFVWITSISLEAFAGEAEISPLAEKIMEVMDSWDMQEWKDVLKDLYRNPKGSRFLEALVEGQTVEIQADAVQKIRRGIRTEG